MTNKDIFIKAALSGQFKTVNQFCDWASRQPFVLHIYRNTIIDQEKIPQTEAAYFELENDANLYSVFGPGTEFDAEVLNDGFVVKIAPVYYTHAVVRNQRDDVNPIKEEGDDIVTQ